MDQQTLLEAALDRLGEGFAIFDADFRLIHCNKVFRDLRDLPGDFCVPGLSLEALIRFNGERGDFGPGDATSLIAERIKEILESKDREVEREMSDGKILRIRYQRLESGGLIMSLQDRTAERASQAGEKLSQERLSIVSRATSDGLYDWDITNDVLVISDRLSVLFGFDTDNLSSAEWANRIHFDDRERYRDTMIACFKERRERFNCEYRIEATEGDPQWARDQAIAMYDENGRAYRLVGAISNISEIKESQAETETAQNRLLGSLSAISEGYLLLDADENLLMWNRRFVEIYGAAWAGDINPSLRVGRSFVDVLRDGFSKGAFAGKAGDLEGWIANRNKNKDRSESRFEVPLSNGTWVRVSERRMAGGGRVSISTDITETRQREKELSETRDDALNAMTRFSDAIESMPSGFVLFDAEDRIVVVNSVFRHFFQDLADTIKIGNTLRDILRAGIERGLFPMAADDPERFLEETLEQRLNPQGVREQLMTGGLWLQVRERRTSDGGLVAGLFNADLLVGRVPGSGWNKLIPSATIV